MRQAAGLTQIELEKRLGISQAWVVRIENHGYDVSLATLRRYMKALGEGFSLEVWVKQPLDTSAIMRHELPKAHSHWQRHR